MSEREGRRAFLGTAACAGGCAFLTSVAARLHGAEEPPKKAYDFDKLTYCCFACSPEQCPLFKASLSDDREFKKKEAEKWKERFKREFTLDEVFCFGCKAEPQKLGASVNACTVRACVISKALVSCAHCCDLTTCQQKLWVDYPEFRKHVLAIQKDVLG